METYVTPIGREELIARVGGFIERMPLPEEVEMYRQAISTSALEILSILPEEVGSNAIISCRCRDRAKNEDQEFADRNSLDLVKIGTILKNVCREINLILYREYIEEMFGKIRQYCLEHEAPERWGLGSVQHFDREGWSLPFYALWRYRIEGEGDECFEKMLVKSEILPDNWRASYKTQIKEAKRVCPFKWSEMSGPQIAEALVSLRKRSSDLKKARNDPSRKPWGMCSISAWEGEDGEPWGKSFWTWWRKNKEESGSHIFAREVKPHLPADWQGRFKG